jgi:hypothetical protein
MEQETLEEVSKSHAIYELENNYKPTKESFKLACKRNFIKGAKWQQQQDKKLYSEEVICKNCKKVISVEHINSHLFMAVKSGGLVHWNCKTI